MTAYYVSNSGNDSGNGLSPSTPFKTIAFACTKATQPGDIVNLKGGDVFRETLKPLASGSNGKPITFQSYGDGQAIISGCEIITGTWTTYQGSILQTSIPPSWVMGAGKDQVFIDGQPLIPAIWPKSTKLLYERTMLDYAIATSGSYNSTADASGNVTGTYTASGIDSSWVGKKITFLPGSAWGAQVGTIVSSGNDRVSFSFKYNSFNSGYNPIAGNYFFLWGNLASLTQPNEYLVDPNTNILYIWPENFSNRQLVELRTRKLGCELDGLSNITIQNIHLFAAKISGRNGGYIKLSQLLLEYPVHDLNSGSESPINLSNSPYSSVLDSDIRYSSGDGIVMTSSSNCICKNNAIVGTGYNSIAGNGILTSYQGPACIVDSNTVISTGSHGIVMQSPGGICQYNRVVDAGRWTTDIAGINVPGFGVIGYGDMQGLRISHNLSHDHYAIYDPSRSLWGATGFRTDSGFTEGVSNIIFDRNISWNTSSQSLLIYPLKNTQTNYLNAQIKVLNNTLQGKLVLSQKTSHSQQGIEIYNNIASETIGKQPEAIVVNNLFAYSIIDGNLTGDPLLKSPNDIDYRLSEDSPCKGAGKVVLPFTPDSAVDIGAIPYSSAPPKAGASILQKHISNLVFTQQNATTVFISGFSLGRGISKNVVFRYVINGNSVLESYSFDSYNSLSGQITGGIKFPASTQNLGIAKIEVSLDGGQTFLPTNGTFKIGIDSPSQITADSLAANTSSGTEQVVDGISKKRIPIKPNVLNGSLIAHDPCLKPSLVKVHISNWISQGLINDRNQISILDRSGNEQPIWLEGVPYEDSHSLLWFKSSVPLQQTLVQSYESEPCFYLDYANNVGSNTNNLQVFFPEMASAILWLKAHEATVPFNSNVSSWNGIGKAVQADVSKQPVLRSNVLNGFPGIEFDGINDFMLASPSVGNPGAATFIVIYCNPDPGSTTNQRLLSSSSPGTRDYEVGIQVLPILLSNNIPSPQKNGYIIVQTCTGKDLTNFHLGIRHSAFSNPYKGYLLEVLVIDRVLSAKEINTIKSYFKAKYQTNLCQIDPIKQE